ncbi:MFS transporter [Micromonospora echinofusca]|uniref:MFS transporter n=1 Tax=Micromonospora echinofusca TaxID=47858 RepID=A0ABS3VJX7_MICEH|nr:MFS transporter [Micromonospora echinofusca]MBO4204826.1 MFS transporter [Micromonospora echinofusca]
MSSDTATVPAGPRAGGHRATHGRRMVAALAVTQTVGYGTLYYAYAVLLAPMATDLGTSTATVTGALTASVLAGAGMSVPVGRWLDRHGGRALMTVGSLVATVLVLAWSQVQTVWQLYAVMIGVGATGAMVLYEPAFAVIVSWFDAPRRDNALLAVTVVAGFASTIFLPLTGLLVARLDWRTALVVLAVTHGAVTVPLHAAAVRRPSRGLSHHGKRRSVSARAATGDPGFWLLVAAFVAHAAATSMMVVHLVGYLTGRGHPAIFAATVTGLLGVLSVTGRVVLTVARRFAPLTTVVAVIFGIQAVAAAALPVVATSRAGAVVAVVAFGLGFGVSSLAVPALLVDRYGTAAYGSIAGVLALPVTVSRATAPLAAAALLSVAGDHLLLPVAVAACSVVAALGILAGPSRAAGG